MFKLYIIIVLPIISLLAIAEYPTFILILISIFIAICFYIYERAKENQAVTIKNTDLKKDKELSQKTLIKNSLYFSKNTQPIMVLDRKYIIISSNEASHKFLGYNPDGKNISLVLRSPEIDNAIDKLNSEKLFTSVDFTVFSVVQKYLTAQLFYQVINSNPSIIITLSDNTNQYIIDHLKTNFVSNVSHELRTPLASILGFLETIEGPAKNDETKKKEFYQIIRGEAERMQRLVNDLLSLTKVEESEFKPPSEKIDLMLCLESAIDVTKVIAEKKNIIIEKKFDNQNNMYIKGNQDQVIEVFENLLDNAITYSIKGKTIKVSVDSDGHYAIVTFKDQGVGITGEELVKITQRFYRCKDSIKFKKHSSGLGLSIVKHILNRHEGKLEVSSELGVGSEFRTFLPLI